MFVKRETHLWNCLPRREINLRACSRRTYLQNVTVNMANCINFLASFKYSRLRSNVEDMFTDCTYIFLIRVSQSRFLLRFKGWWKNRLVHIKDEMISFMLVLLNEQNEKLHLQIYDNIFQSLFIVSSIISCLKHRTRYF